MFKKFKKLLRCFMVMTALSLFILPGQGQAQEKTSEDDSDVVEIIRMLLPALETDEEREVPSFYRPLMTEGDVEGAFVDLTYKSIKGEDGQAVGWIHDILVDPETGSAAKIIYTRPEVEDETNPDLASVDYRHVLVQEQDGDIQLSIDETLLKDDYKFQYTPDIFKQYISLKYLRHGNVIDSFDETVGRIMAVIYRDNKIENIFVALSENLASGQDRLFNVPFEASQIVQDQDGFDLHLTARQTESIADQLYARQLPLSETDEE